MNEIEAIDRAFDALQSEDERRTEGLRNEIASLLGSLRATRVADANAERRRIRMWAMDHAVRLYEQDMSLRDRSLPEIAADIEAYVTSA